jgi:hypothetical protein
LETLRKGAWHASSLIASGLEIVSISRRLGHGSPTITLAVYAHLFHNSDERVAAAIEAVLTPAAATAKDADFLKIGCQSGANIAFRTLSPAQSAVFGSVILLGFSIAWRRRRDSNPGYGFRPYNGLANRRLQPLGHVSVGEIRYRPWAFASMD